MWIGDEEMKDLIVVQTRTRTRLSWGAAGVVRFVITVANDPARRFRLIWQLFAWGIGVVFIVIGSGYLVGGRAASSSRTLQLLVNLQGHNYHIHGAILMALGVLLVQAIGEVYTRRTRIVLQLITLYSLITASMIFGSWIVYDVDFAAPWWYVLTAFFSIVLLIMAPPLIDGRMYTGTKNGGGSA